MGLPACYLRITACPWPFLSGCIFSAVILVGIQCPTHSTLTAGVVCIWEHASEMGDGWKSMEAIQLSSFLCCWKACVAQEDKRYRPPLLEVLAWPQDLTDMFIQYERGWEAPRGPLCSQLFYLFMCHLPSFLWWTEMKVACTPLQASWQIQLKYLILVAYARVEPLNLFNCTVTILELFFCSDSGITGIQNWDWTLKRLWERLVELNMAIWFSANFCSMWNSILQS